MRLLPVLILFLVTTVIVPSWSIAATFVTVSAGSGGQIAPQGKTPLLPDSQLAFHVTPHTGYHIKKVMIDGRLVSTESGISVVYDGKNHKVSALFEKDVLDVTISSGAGGTISPKRLKVPYGTRNVKYSIKPLKGYKTVDVRLDGISLGDIATVFLPVVTAPVTIEASFTPKSNAIPVADAGEDRVAMVNEMVVLDGSSGSDADGDPLSFSWVFLSKPSGSRATLSDPTATAPAFIPDVEGFYRLQLAVSDGKATVRDTIEVAVADVPALQPLADAGGSRETPVKVLTYLDGRQSRGAGGIPLSFQWTMISKPEDSTATIDNAGTPTPSFIPDRAGVYVVQLVVRDGLQTSNPAEIAVTAVNVAPVAVATTDPSGTVGRSLLLDGSKSSDVNGDELTFSWSIVTAPVGSIATIVDAGSSVASLVPDKSGRYSLALVVSDGRSGDSANISADITISAAPLPFRVTDAEYSLSLDKIVAVGTYPSNLLHVYDPVTQEDVTVPLPLAPTCVSVGPDGFYAAVGHDGWMTLVGLAKGERLKTIPVAADAIDIVLAGNGFAYVFPARDQWAGIHSIELETGIETVGSEWMIYAGTRGKLHPDGLSMYGADNGISPSDIEKYDISAGTAQALYDSPYHGDYSMCGDLWISQDGFRIFTKCGNVFRSSQVAGEDMKYNGKLEGLGYVRHLTHSSAAGTVASIPGSYYETSIDSEVQIHNYAFLTLRERLLLPSLPFGPKEWKTHGRFVFYDSKGERLYVVVQADETSGALTDFAVVGY